MSANTRKGRPNVPARLITDDHGHRDPVYAVTRNGRRVHIAGSTPDAAVCGKPIARTVACPDDRAAVCRLCAHFAAKPPRTYACLRCWRHRHREAFDVSGRYMRRICRDCLARAREERQRRAVERQSANGLWEKRCSHCRRWRLRDRHFSRRSTSVHGRALYNSWCKTCIAEWQRIRYHERAFADGRTVIPYPARQAPPEGPNAGPRLFPEPLRLWLEAVLTAEIASNDPEGVEGLCRRLGWQERQLRSLLCGEYRTVGLHVADRLLTGYGRPVVIRSRDIERRLVAWAQGLPGNGARLLAYLDRAEAIGHLADVALLRVDDLYPELDEEGDGGERTPFDS